VLGDKVGDVEDMLRKQFAGGSANPS
jgi:hypothetical protein